MSALTHEEITAKLGSLSGWSFADDKISKKFEFGNFREAMAFIVRMSYEAEQRDHHPELFNVRP
jgi:4a-hydroxytetrahydrobiopterin dehydratase